MTGAGADWPAIAGDVAVALLGEPSSRSGRELRYGRKGSLSVHLDKGTWRDHESATGGGVLDLVKRERGCDTAGAMAWLESAGFVESRDRERPVRRPEPFPRSRTHERTARTPESRPGGACGASAGDPTPDPADIAPDPRAAAVVRPGALWRGAGAVEGTPAAACLTRRNVWRPERAPWPACVRWLAAADAPVRVPGAGALLWRFERDGRGVAVQLDALDREGRYVEPRWRRTYGKPKGAAMRIPGPWYGAPLPALAAGDAWDKHGEPDPDAHEIHVAEGPADALAIAAWLDAEAWALGGAGFDALAPALLAMHRPAVIHADGPKPDDDEPSAPAGNVGTLAAALRVGGLAVRVVRYHPGRDPAADLPIPW